MKDQILNDLIDEIALEGDQGCTFDQLFTIVENLTVKSLDNIKLITPIWFDEPYRAYFWNSIRNNEQLVFVENETVIDTTDMSYTEMKGKADKVKVKAIEELQDHNIYGNLKAAKNSLVNNHKLILNLVAKSRYQGIGQHKLTELTSMDSKSVFYYLKKLDQLGLIVKESAYADKVNTRIIFLKRFSPQSNSNENDTGDLYRIGTFKDNLINLLRQAENNMIALADVVKLMGFLTVRQSRWAKVQISRLHDQGAVEKFIAHDGKTEKLSVRLVEQFNATPVISYPSAIEENQDSKSSRQIDALYRDLPPEYQFYQDVVASGEKGLTRQDLVKKYPEIDPDTFTLFFESAISQPTLPEHENFTVYITEELDGKTRVFRYFALNGWRKFNEKLGKAIMVPKAKNGFKELDLEEPQVIDHIRKAFDVPPFNRGSANRKRNRKTTANMQLEDEEHISTARKRKAITPRNIHTSNSRNEEKSAETASPTVNMCLTRSQQHEYTCQSAPPAKDMPPSSNKRKIDQLNDTPTPANKDTIKVAKSNNPAAHSVEAPSTSKRGKKTQFDDTKMRRHAILLDMMEKQHVRELNQGLLVKFNELETVAEGGQKMAMKTLSRMTKQLHEEQKLKVHVCTVEQVSGSTEMKTLLLHANVNEDSDEVKQFINMCKLGRPIINGGNKRKEYEKLNVERLPLVQEIITDCVERNHAREVDNNSKRTHAVTYGWIRSKWLRARELHESLFQHYLQVDPRDQTIDMMAFVQDLSLETLAKICASLPYHNEDLKEFMYTESNRSLSLKNLPSNIRLMVFQAKKEIRFILNLLLSILEAMGLVEAVHDLESESKYGIASKYRLQNEGNIRDYAFKKRSILQTVVFSNIHDVQQFWDDLRSACLFPQQYLTKQDTMKLDKGVDKNDPLFNIDKSRTWQLHVMLTAKQKGILDSYIDPVTKTIPSDNPALRCHLAKETNLPTKRIRVYYEGVFGAMHKKEILEKKRRIKFQRQLAMSADSTINDLMLASKEKRKVDAQLIKMKEEDPFNEPTFVGSRRFRRLRVRVEPYQDQNQAEHGYSKKTYHNFDPLEKDLLLYAYCIMKARAEGKKFYWRPITKVMTNRSANVCRRAFNAMTRYDNGILVTIEKLKSQWKAYYKEGMEKQEIQDERHWDTLDFDLCSFVEYFIIKIKEDEERAAISSIYVLPTKYEDIEKNLTVVRDEEYMLKLKQSENNQGISANIYSDHMYDAPKMIKKEDANDRSSQLIKILIKMMLITPDDLYHPEMAYRVMKNYPNKIIEKALEELKTEGFIVKNKSGYGRIPGRAFNVSEKFLKIANGVLPFGLIDNARSHYATVTNSQDVDLNILKIDSGIAAATLDLLSQGKISLFMKQGEKYFKTKESLLYPKTSAVSLQKVYIYHGLDISIKKSDTLVMDGYPDLSQRHIGIVTLPSPEQIETCLQELSETNNLALKVYNVLKTFEAAGASMNTIVSLVENGDTKSIYDAIDLLVTHRPPLIQQFGFKQLRYVVTEFSSDWLLKTKDDDRTFLNPLMWNDISGRVIQSALDGCAKAVLSHILRQPGISHANLLKNFEGFLTEYELLNLLNYLTDAKRIISRKVTRGSGGATRASIFYKRPRLSSVASSNLICANEITYYWLSNNYYLFK